MSPMHVTLRACVTYCITSSVIGQDESNPALWLATRAGKMELFCPLGTTRRVPKRNFRESYVINLVLFKLVRSRWLNIGPFFFCESCQVTQGLLAGIVGIRCDIILIAAADLKICFMFLTLAHVKSWEVDLYLCKDIVYLLRLGMFW